MNVEDKIILSMIQGYSVSCVIYAACELNILDHLYNRAMTRKELCKKINGKSETTNLLLDVLVVHGLIEESNGTLNASSVGKKLAKQEENSLKGFAIFAGRECIPAWLRISDAIKEHTFPFKKLSHKNFFEGIEKENRFEDFRGMMGSVSHKIDLSSYLEKYNQKEKLKIVDIGGGTGEIISKFLFYFTQAKGLILDLPHVNNEAKEYLIEKNLLNRCDFQNGDFFEPNEINGDIFILSRVLHDWEDDKAELILKNIKKNMDDKSKLLIIEKIMPDSLEKRNGALFMSALHIWTLCGGKERTRQEYNELLKKVGMKIESSYPLNEGNYILEVRLNQKWEEGTL